MTNEKPKEVQRFNLTFRIQHVILMVTFLLLAFTGWSLKYTEPMLEHAGWWIRMWEKNIVRYSLYMYSFWSFVQVPCAIILL